MKKRPPLYWPGVFMDIGIVTAIIAGGVVMYHAFSWFIDVYLLGN